MTLRACLLAALPFLLIASGLPLPEGWTKLDSICQGQWDDLYIATNPGYGMYGIPTQIGVFSDTGKTNLTNARYSWSGFDVFSNLALSENPSGGRFMSQDRMEISVRIQLASGWFVEVYATLRRRFGCWNEWTNWQAEPFVDENGDGWPRTLLIFEYQNLRLLPIHYNARQIGCSSEVWTMTPTYTCDGITAEYNVGTTNTLPNNEACYPGIKYAASSMDFHGENGTMVLTLASGATQVFRGTPIDFD